MSGVLGSIAEIFRYFWRRRLWWLMPMIAVILVFAVLLLLGTVAGIGPVIYTVF